VSLLLPAPRSHVTAATQTIKISACSDRAQGSASIKLNNVALNTTVTGLTNCSGSTYESGYKAVGTLVVGA